LAASQTGRSSAGAPARALAAQRLLGRHRAEHAAIGQERRQRLGQLVVLPARHLRERRRHQPQLVLGLWLRGRRGGIRRRHAPRQRQ